MGMGVVNAFGLYFVVDASGMVLECAGSVYPDTVAGPQITNLVWIDNARATVGSRLPVRDSAQLQAMQRVLGALDTTNLLGRVASLDLKSLENIKLLTTDGASIVLDVYKRQVDGVTTQRSIESYQTQTATLVKENEMMQQQLTAAESGDRIRNRAQNELGMLRRERAQTETIYIQAPEKKAQDEAQALSENHMEILDFLLGLLNVFHIGE